MIIPDVLRDLDTSQIIINLGQILIVIILFGVLHYILRKSLDEIGRRRGLDNRVINQIRLFEKYVLYTIATLTILGILGIDLTVIATSVGVAGIAVGFAARDIISNFLSGIFIIIDKVYVVNDVVDIDGTYGIVEIITLRNTQIRTFDGNIVTVPNSQVADSKVINMTSGESKLLATTSVNVGYKEDSDKVKRILEDSAKSIEGVYLDEKHSAKFQQDELDVETLGYRVTIFYYVDAHNEPWITSKVFNRAVKKMIDEDIEFQRQVPRVTFTRSLGEKDE